MSRAKGFTLIELLIVVAIIAILAAIAVPNFLEAQARSKVSASKADIRSLVTAIESYSIDWNDYPHYPDPAFASSKFMNSNVLDIIKKWRGYTPWSLTTPLAYMTSLPKDKFVYAKASTVAGHPWGINYLQLYQWEHSNTPIMRGFWERRMPHGIKYLMVGVGPDGATSLNTTLDGFHNNAAEYLQSRSGAAGIGQWYDPSNGTVSHGDIIYHGPGLGFEYSNARDVTKEPGNN